MGSGRKGNVGVAAEDGTGEFKVPPHIHTRMCGACWSIQIWNANVYRPGARSPWPRAAFHPADLVFDPTLAHWGLRFGATRPLTRNPLAREAVCLLSNGRCDLPLGRAVLAAGRTPRLTWILLASSAMN